MEDILIAAIIGGGLGIIIASIFLLFFMEPFFDWVDETTYKVEKFFKLN